MILLSKEGKPTDHARHLRNIAWSSTSGKMCWSCMAALLSPFLTKNEYIDPTINKGAIPGIPGCLEHSWVLVEALLQQPPNCCHSDSLFLLFVFSFTYLLPTIYSITYYLLPTTTIPPPVESILGWSVGRIPRFGTSTTTSACLPARPTADGGTRH